MYFSKFPLLSTKIGNAGIQIEDFFARIVPSVQYNNLSSVLTPYFVGDGERIEDVAFQLYGDVLLHWVVILCNNIIDPYAEWPLADDVLTKQIFSKYNFRVRVSAGHGLVVGGTVQSSNGDVFRVEDVDTEQLLLNSDADVAYLARTDFLYDTNSETRPPITIFSVDDPLSSIHHYEEVDTGYEVDFDSDRLGLGEIIPITNEDYENRLNDAKRNIRVLDKRYLGDFIQIFDREMNK